MAVECAVVVRSLRFDTCLGSVLDMIRTPQEIRRIHYVWAMVRQFSEDLSEPPKWKLHEMGIEYQAPLLA